MVDLSQHPEFLTVEEVVDLLRTTKGAIYTQANRNTPPGGLSIKVGKRRLFARQDLEDYLNGKLDRVER